MDKIKVLIDKIKEFVAFVKMAMEIKKALEDVKAQCKDEVLALADDIDSIVAKFKASPSTADDKLCPLLEGVSQALKKLVA